MQAPLPIFSSRWLVIAICVAALTIAGGAYRSYLMLVKVYSATSEIEIVQPDTNPNGFSPARDFEILQSPTFLKPIITDLQLDRIWAKRVYHTSLDQLPMQDALSYFGVVTSFYQVPGTSMIRITVLSEVPKEACDIANAIADRFVLRLPSDTLAKDPARIITRAEPPEYPSLPNHTENIAIAAGIGIVLGAIIATIIQFFLRAIIPQSNGMKVPPPGYYEHRPHGPPSVDY